MAYTDYNRKIPIRNTSKFRMAIFATVVEGDLLGLDSSNNGLKLADQSDNVAAVAVALQSGVTGDTIWCAAGGVFDAPPSLTAGVYTAQNFCDAADVGDPLYLGESGKPQSSKGATNGQQVGFMISRTQILIMPSTFISSTSQTLSGTLDVTGAVTVGGALGVTGAITSATNLTITSGTFTITSGNAVLTAGSLTLTLGNVVLTAGNLTLTLGNEVITAGNLTLTAGDIYMTAGTVLQAVTSVSTTPKTLTTNGGVCVVDTSTSNIVITLPTAVVGARWTFVTTSATKTLEIDASSGDKILNTSYAAKDKLTNGGAAGDCVTLLALSTTNWIEVGTSRGTWTGS